MKKIYRVFMTVTEIPNQLIDATNISASARMLWIYYSSNSEDFNPSNKVTAQSIGMSENTVKKGKKELQKHKMIEIKKTHYKGGGGLKDIVSLNHPSQWEDTGKI